MFLVPIPHLEMQLFLQCIGFGILNSNVCSLSLYLLLPIYPYTSPSTPVLNMRIITITLSNFWFHTFAPVRIWSQSFLSLNLLHLAVLSFLITLWWQDMLLNSELLASLIFTLTFIPHVMMLFWVLYRVLQRFNCLSHCVEFVQRQSLYQSLLSFTSDRIRLQQTAADTSDHDKSQPLL